MTRSEYRRKPRRAPEIEADLDEELRETIVDWLQRKWPLESVSVLRD